jgi:alpha-galactosidase
MKITFMGAGSTIFARNIIGDSLTVECLRDSVFALYDIDADRLKESKVILEAIQHALGDHGKIECYLGVENQKRKPRFTSNREPGFSITLLL